MKVLKIGEYAPRVVRKGVEETTLDIPAGGIYWLVRLDKDVEMDVGTQAEAEIISRLVRIEAYYGRWYHEMDAFNICYTYGFWCRNQFLGRAVIYVHIFRDMLCCKCLEYELGAEEMVKTRRSPAAARFAREKLEKELTIRFLVSKIHDIRYELEHLLSLKGSSQRYIGTCNLLNEVRRLSEDLGAKEPHRSMSFYVRRRSSEYVFR